MSYKNENGVLMMPNLQRNNLPACSKQNGKGNIINKLFSEGTLTIRIALVTNHEFSVQEKTNTASVSKAF